MLLPGILIVFVYNYLPMGGLVMAFQQYKPTRGLLGSAWVGLQNFRLLLSFPNTKQVVLNTLIIATSKLVLGLIVPVVFALLLDEIRSRRFVRSVQTIVYLPYFLSWVILGGIFFNILSPSTGIINRILEMVGLPTQYFLGDNQHFRWVLVLTDIWKTFGYGSIIYLAALTSIDSTLYEAAAIDGANRFRQVLVVTLPGISSIVFVMAVLSLGNILNAGFDQVLNMYSPQVYQTGDILDTFIYRIGLQQAQYSLSTAVGFFRSVISFLMISISYFLAYRYGNYRIF